MKASNAISQISAYVSIFPEEKARVQPVLDLIRAFQEDAFDRSTMVGHVTASIFILNQERDAATLIHHRALNKWLQPGGHIEQIDPDIVSAALREGSEETGIRNLEILPINGIIAPIDIDVHAIPARPDKGEGAHVHHDCAYLGCASSAEPVIAQAEEVYEVDWVPLKTISSFENARMRLLAQKSIGYR